MTQDSKSNPGAAGSQQNEGEGNRTAARQYNQDQQNFAQSGKVDEKAKEARDALDSGEGKDLADAEAAGKSHARGEDPQLKR
jgi:hypothetical protein